MKFYSTVLIAIVLFGLCLIERKAKEEEVLKNTFQKDSDGEKRNLKLFSDNMAGKESKDIATNFAVDTTSQEMNQKPVLNISLSNYFVTGN